MSSPPLSPTREALLDAAYDVVVAGDWAKARMADVAAAAGVSRQTLYNEFGSKDGIGAALTLRETERFLAGTGSAMHDCPDPVSAVRAAVDYTLAEAADNPLVKAVLTDDRSALLPFITTRADQVYATAGARISAYLTERWPALRAADVALASEAAVRLTISYLVSPAGPVGATADRVAAVAARILHPPGGFTS